MDPTGKAHRVFFQTHRKPERTHRKMCADMIQTSFGRTDLRISVSRTEFDEEADFEVCSGVALQKLHQIDEKPGQARFRCRLSLSLGFARFLINFELEEG